MRRLVERAQNWAGLNLTSFKAAETDDRPGGLRVLTLDGGGIRGIFALIVLEVLMEQVRLIDRPSSLDAMKPCDYFDYICGTSTGGLLAIMLGRLRMDIESCKQAYRSLSTKIFHKSFWYLPGRQWWDAYWNKPWFSGQPLEFAVKQVVKQRISIREREHLQSQGTKVEDAPLRPERETSLRCFVCALADQNHECDRIRSYRSTTDVQGNNFAIWQACRAKSAAPLYFPPFEHGERKYFDGGLEGNNPIIEGVREAIQEHPNRPFKVIVSIGTGKSEPREPRRWHSELHSRLDRSGD